MPRIFGFSILSEIPSFGAAFPEGTIIGPVLEVHIVKILDGCGIEVANP